MSGGCSGSATETTSFVYDGDGKRVQATASGTTTSFIGNYYELTGAQVTKYYFAGTQRIAMRKYTIPQPMTLEYLLGDYLSSTSITTDSNGTKVSEIRYKPWGEIRYSWTSGTVTSPAYKLVSYTFTGQYSYMDDPSTTGTTKGFGLIFCNARFYSPYINHFLSADTIVPNPSNPQSWNRYSYVLNNPLKYTDPTGHMQQVDDGGGVACTVTHTCGGGSGGGGGNNNGGGWNPVITPLNPGDLPCGGMMTCGQQSAYQYAASLLPFSGSGACYSLLHDPVLCDSDSWQNSASITILNAPGMDYFDFTVDYSDNAVVTQDIATTLSVAGGTAEIVSTVAGCVAGIETGVAPGCAAGYAAGRAFHTAITNPLEQKFSFISLAATIKANGNWTSESSITALATWGAGQASSEGMVDAAIDLYASGYNHGWFCGINSFPSCFP